MKPKLKIAVRFMQALITVILLGYVFYRAGLFTPEGRAEFLRMLSSVHFGWLMASLAMSVVLNFASTLKWFMLLRARDIAVRFMRLFAYYYVGKFFNLVLPTSLGGDLIRIYETARHTQQKAESLASVFVERFTGMIALIVLVLLVVALNFQVFNLPVILISLCVCLVAVFAITWLLLDRRPFQVFQRRLDSWFPFLAPFTARMATAHEAIRSYADHPSALYWAFFNSALFLLLATFNVWITALAFGTAIEWQHLFTAVPIILMLMNLPISIGGLGLMEFAYTFTFDLTGYSATLALSTAMLMRFKTIVDSAMGGLLHLSMKARPTNSMPIGQADKKTGPKPL